MNFLTLMKRILILLLLSSLTLHSEYCPAGPAPTYATALKKFQERMQTDEAHSHAVTNFLITTAISFPLIIFGVGLPMVYYYDFLQHDSARTREFYFWTVSFIISCLAGGYVHNVTYDYYDSDSK